MMLLTKPTGSINLLDHNPYRALTVSSYTQQGFSNPESQKNLPGFIANTCDPALTRQRQKDFEFEISLDYQDLISKTKKLLQRKT